MLHWCVWFFSLLWQNMATKAIWEREGLLWPMFGRYSLQPQEVVRMWGGWRVVSTFRKQREINAGAQPTVLSPPQPSFGLVTPTHLWGLGCTFFPQLNLAWNVLTSLYMGLLGDSSHTQIWKWRLAIPVGYFLFNPVSKTWLAPRDINPKSHQPGIQ